MMMPATEQKKVLILSAIAVVLIVFGGSWAITSTPKNTSENPSSPNTSETPKPKKTLTLLLVPEQGKGNLTYTLKVAPTTELLQSVGLRLKIAGAEVVGTSQNNTFSSSSELGSSGWQAAVNSVLKTENNNTTMEVGFVNLDPKGAPVAEELTLGSFTVKALSPTEPQFTVDQAISTAFTKDGSSLVINLVVQPSTQK